MKSSHGNTRRLAAVFAFSFACIAMLEAQTIAPRFLGVGTNSFDGWVNMNNANPDFSGWPTKPADSNAAGSGDAQLVRVAGSPIFAMESLYFLSYQQVANALGGTLQVSDPAPVTGVKTIALQVEIGGALGYDFHSPDGYPLLKINGQSAVYSPTHAVLLNRYQSGTFDSPETGEEPVYVKTVGYQWNVEDLGLITSIQIEFSAVTHAQIYEIRLDQTDVLQTRTVFVPEYLRLAELGAPHYDGASTSVTHLFTGPPSSTLAVEFSESAGQPPWTSSELVETGAGTFAVTFTAQGDRRAAWSQNMFFRAKYPDYQ